MRGLRLIGVDRPALRFKGADGASAAVVPPAILPPRLRPSHGTLAVKVEARGGMGIEACGDDVEARCAAAKMPLTCGHQKLRLPTTPMPKLSAVQGDNCMGRRHARRVRGIRGPAHGEKDQARFSRLEARLANAVSEGSAGPQRPARRCSPSTTGSVHCTIDSASRALRRSIRRIHRIPDGLGSAVDAFPELLRRTVVARNEGKGQKDRSACGAENGAHGLSPLGYGDRRTHRGQHGCACCATPRRRDPQSVLPP